MHVPCGRDVIEEHRVPFGESLGHGLRPVTGFVGQVWTGVPRKPISEVDRVVAGETETDHAAPIVRDLEEFDADLKRDVRASC